MAEYYKVNKYGKTRYCTYDMAGGVKFIDSPPSSVAGEIIYEDLLGRDAILDNPHIKTKYKEGEEVIKVSLRTPGGEPVGVFYKSKFWNDSDEKVLTRAINDIKARQIVKSLGPSEVLVILENDIQDFIIVKSNMVTGETEKFGECNKFADFRIRLLDCPCTVRSSSLNNDCFRTGDKDIYTQICFKKSRDIKSQDEGGVRFINMAEGEDYESLRLGTSLSFLAAHMSPEEVDKVHREYLDSLEPVALPMPSIGFMDSSKILESVKLMTAAWERRADELSKYVRGEMDKDKLVTLVETITASYICIFDRNGNESSILYVDEDSLHTLEKNLDFCGYIKEYEDITGFNIVLSYASIKGERIKLEKLSTDRNLVGQAWAPAVTADALAPYKDLDDATKEAAKAFCTTIKSRMIGTISMSAEIGVSIIVDGSNKPSFELSPGHICFTDKEIER